MNNINKIALPLIVFVLSLIVIGSSCVSATEINQTNDNNHINNEVVDTSYMENNNFKNVTKDYEADKLSLGEGNIDVYATNETCYVGDTVTFNFITDPHVSYLTDDDGLFAFYIDEMQYMVEVPSTLPSTWQLDTSQFPTELGVGVHNTELMFTGYDYYPDAHGYGTLTILKHPVSITNIEYDFDYTNNISINFNVQDDNSNDITAGIVNVYESNNLINTIHLSTDLCTFKLTPDYNYRTLKFVYLDENGYYKDTEREVFLNIDKLNARLYLSRLQGYHGDTINNIISIDSDYTINEGFITVDIDGNTVEIIEVNKNNVDLSIDLSNYLEGSYQVDLTYYSEVYEFATLSTTLNVKKVPTITYGRNITTNKNNTVNITAYVYNNVDDTTEGRIEFFIDQTSIYTGSIIGNNITFEYAIPNTLTYGTHELLTIFYGNTRYNASNTTANLVINKFSNKVSIRNTTLNEEGLIVINTRLYSYNKTVSDGELSLYVDGVLVEKKTVINNDTQFILPSSYSTGVEYNVKLEYTDSKYFNDCENTTTIKVNKYNTTLFITTYKNNDTVNITSYVYSNNYDTINKGVASIYINDNLIDIVNVENSKANKIVNISTYADGNYTVKVVYSGDNTHQNVTNTTKFEKTTTLTSIYIQTSKTLKTTPADSVIINATLMDYQGNIVEENVDCNITINNTLYSSRFNNGILIYEYTAPTTVQNMTITITTSNITHYKNTTTNITLRVQKNSTYIQSSNIYATKLSSLLINATLHHSNQSLLTIKTPGVIKINNKTIYNGYFINGYMEYNLTLNSNYKNNGYNITIIAGESIKYTNSSKNIILTLYNKTQYVTSKNIIKNNTIIFNATTYDQVTKNIVDMTQSVVIKINGLTITPNEYSTQNGHILYAINNTYSTGKYNITIKIGPNGLYSQYQWNGTINISGNFDKSNIKMIVPKITAKANTTINIQATLYDKNFKIIKTSVDVAIKINENTITTLTTTNGKINYNYKLPDNYQNENYNISIVTGETSTYLKSTANTTLTIIKNYEHIQTTNITSKSDEKIHIRANITDENGNIIKTNQAVNIKLADETIVDTNAVDGIIDYEYTIPTNIKNGVYNLIIKTGDTACFYHATAYTTIKIE